MPSHESSPRKQIARFIFSQILNNNSRGVPGKSRRESGKILRVLLLEPGGALQSRAGINVELPLPRRKNNVEGAEVKEN